MAPSPQQQYGAYSLFLPSLVVKILSPLPLLRTFLPCFKGQLALLQIVGTLPTILFVFTGWDWEWTVWTRPLSSTGISLAIAALYIGILAPIILPFCVYVYALVNSNNPARRDRVKLAVRLSRAALLALLYITFLKTCTGRAHPPDMGESIGTPCRCNPPLFSDDCRRSTGRVCTDESTYPPYDSLTPRQISARDTVDSSRVWEFFGAFRDWEEHKDSVVAGWPSGHTQSSTTMVTVLLGEGCGKGGGGSMLFAGKWRRLFVFLSISYAFTMAVLMAVSVHWLTDVLTGFPVGLAVGLAVIWEGWEEDASLSSDPNLSVGAKMELT